MTTLLSNDWRQELDVADWKPPKFFQSAEDVDSAVPVPPQAHALRRAFDRMNLSGIVCFQNAPMIYFKEITESQRNDADAIHRSFWYQGLAPILVLIDPTEIRVYSGMSLPASQADGDDNSHRLVETLDRIAQAAEMRRLVLSIESGEYFRAHVASFDPTQRVDGDLLSSLGKTRSALCTVTSGPPNTHFLEALLCRVVFVCYLFDRGVIDRRYLASLGINGVHLRDVLNAPPVKNNLYALFKQLGTDFNGDLFIDNLDTEAGYVTESHLAILSRFLRGTDVMTGQPSFWPYDFGIIPIETLSAIYEHFLKVEDPNGKRQSGAFYTPRFLAEITLDIALDGVDSLLDKRFLDPACGSGIFLVGLFNRIAEEWKRRNPDADYDRRANALISIIRNNLCGLDIKLTACRIAAFSLYIALLDQLAPPAIQELQRKGKWLPALACADGNHPCEDDGHTIRCGDFFAPSTVLPSDFYLIIGNPPWAKVTGPLSSAEEWCDIAEFPIANRQLATGFLWKAARHQASGGRICFILPAGLIFNHHDTALAFQLAWFEQHTIDVVLNLADMRFNLFAEATGPSLIIRYRNQPPSNGQSVKYLVPKTSWRTSQAEVITILPEDRTEFAIRDVLSDLRAKTPPRVLKERFWGTPRDWKLLDRLAALPSLSATVGQTRERHLKRWVMAEGFKPKLKGTKTEAPVSRPWPDDHLILEAKPKHAHLFVLKSDCEEIGRNYPLLHRTVSATEIFEAPHVLVWYGMRVAFADFPVLFRHSIRGIAGPKSDRGLLMFLAAYLRSPLARYFLFHTSANWGIERSKVHLKEVLHLPFPLPGDPNIQSNAERIVANAAELMTQAIKEAAKPQFDRTDATRQLQSTLDLLVYEYFDIHDAERSLVDDTDKVIIESILPTCASDNVPTLRQSTSKSRGVYMEVLCETLNDWATGGPYRIYCSVSFSPQSGVGAVQVHRETGKTSHQRSYSENGRLIAALDRLQHLFKAEFGTVELLHGIKVIDGNTLYMLKPLAQRFWTRTAALNDADAIATTVLIGSRKETS